MPNYDATGASKFIPEIWSGKLLVKFYNSTVFGEIANTDYDGEIKNQGDTVHIRTLPDIVINDYQKGQDLDFQRPESPNVDLQINKGKYFGLIIDDVDAVQSDIKLMDKWADVAGQQMKIKVDTQILAAVYADAHTKNKGATAGLVSGAINIGAAGAPVSLTKVNVLDYIIDCGLVLDEQNVPEQGRWIVLPAWACAMIKKSDLKDASLTGDGSSILRNGRIGMIDRFTIYNSNNLTAVTDTVQCWHSLFGHKLGLTFASQLTKMETLRAQTTFGNIVRGLNVYGFKVVKSEAIGDLYITKG